MKLSIDQLSAQLKKGLAPVYLLGGEEVLLIEEAQTMIQKHALQMGYQDLFRFNVEVGFDESAFEQCLHNGSLFSERQIIFLNLSRGKSADIVKKSVLKYAEKPLLDKVLVVRVEKLDAATQKTALCKAIDRIGVMIPIWPLTPAQLPHWISQRLGAFKLTADAEGIALLAARTEGNLLATAQEIEKLSLLYEGRVTVEQIEEASSNSTRFTVFSLTDAILQREAKAVLNIFDALRAEGTESILVLWALRRELHQWATWLIGINRGKTLAQQIAGNFMMEKRKSLIVHKLTQFKLEKIYHYLQRASAIDQMIKGVAEGLPWIELRTLAMAMAGEKYK